MNQIAVRRPEATRALQTHRERERSSAQTVLIWLVPRRRGKHVDRMVLEVSGLTLLHHVLLIVKQIGR